MSVTRDRALPRAVVISLVDDTARRESCRAQLDSVGAITWRFLDAVDGRGRTSYPDCYRPRQAERIVGYRLAASEVACFMSHRLAWWECSELDAPLLVLEDDFLLNPCFPEALRAGVAARDLWDVLRLQGLNDRPSVPCGSQDGHAFVQNLADPWGSTAYMVTPAAARRLLAHSRRIVEPVDTFLEAVGRHRQRLVAMHPYPVGVTGASSSMTDRPVRWGLTRWQRRRRQVFDTVERFLNRFAPPSHDPARPPSAW
jgi:glycosyl transferase family 25